jgi:hypothetical protein
MLPFMVRIGFDNEKSLREQEAEIFQRVERFNHRLCLEFGGKLIFDYHAARVLPGYDPNVKMRLRPTSSSASTPGTSREEESTGTSGSPSIPTR